MPGKGWFTGFFDGEGCVRIQTDASRCAKVQTSLVVSVTSVDPRPIEKFAKKFPGYKGKITRVKKWKNSNQRIQYEWAIRGLGALNFCKYVYPCSIVKREQLELAIKFYELPWRTQRSEPGGTWKIRTNENVLVDLQYAENIRRLKHAL